MTQKSADTDSNAGKWNEWYKGIPDKDPAPSLYAEATTYRMAASFFADTDVVEDWGCGRGGFKIFCLSKYVGVDGSRTPFADKIVDLCNYETRSDGILLRHVLEHNYQWEMVLKNAIKSFDRKLCIVLFTPFADTTTEIAHNRHIGVDVPDLSLAKSEIEKHLIGLKWKLAEGITTKSQYKVEHIYFVWREQRGLFRQILDKLRKR
ncbi:hypothetical protein [Methylobacterium gregans]|uniref:hypothetical protein n=1 Tax=Methylobacterium gregans TaxID=374424 RepID=UPI001EE29E3D|nr:hypothetical protein [Methylobacterium gregans]MDQ0521794.1 hypothetical protein [Methylobacterium gregans]GLS52140.1 hypothetical protein GCM10007886_03220 [Methylobacterium gregans]